MNCDIFAGATGWMLTEELGNVTMNDGPNGIRKVLSATENEQAHCFPSLSTAACSFDRRLMRTFGRALAAEASAHGVDIVLGPGINIKRSPLCGRNFEYFSEDPLLTGYLASAFIDGIQSAGIGATVKHFALNNQENYRLVSDSICDEKTMREIYLRAFEIVVKNAEPYMLMASYNRINGEYGTESMLLDRILREEWGYEGVIVSDWGAVNDRVSALLHTLDLEMPGPAPVSRAALEAAIADEKVRAAAEASRKRLLSLSAECRRKGGEVPSASVSEDNLLIAASSAVLLENDGILPIGDGSIAVIGDQAVHGIFQGGGCANVNTPYEVSLLDALDEEFRLYDYYTYDGIKDISRADYVIIFLSQDRRAESEGFDRTSLSLSDESLRALEECRRQNRNIIAVIQAGGVVDCSFADDVRAVLYTGYAGELWGRSLLGLLEGRYCPCGHLAESFPYEPAVNPEFGLVRTHYSEGVFFGYRGSERLRYPFGYGLSYSEIVFSSCQVAQYPDYVRVSAVAENRGGYDTKAVLQVYQDTGEYIRLAGFDSAPVAAGESTLISFCIPVRDLSVFSLDKGFESPEVLSLMFGTDARSFYFSCRERMQTSYSYRPLGLGLIERQYHSDAALERDPVTVNSPIEILLEDKFGTLLVDTMLERVRRMEEWKTSPDEHIRQVMQYPLRCIIGASQGRFSKEMAEHLVSYLKGEASLSDDEKQQMLDNVEMY